MPAIPEKRPAHDPPTPPLKDPGRGVPSGFLPAPLPTVFRFRKQTPTPPVLHKTGDHPPGFQFQKVCFAWSVRREGEGAPPLRSRSRGVGYRVEGVGAPPPARIRREPPSSGFIFSCRYPHLPPPGKKGGPPLRSRSGGVGYRVEGVGVSPLSKTVGLIPH